MLDAPAQHAHVLTLSMRQDVVWERLCAVNGDTDFVRHDFSSFGASLLTAQAIHAATLAQQAFSSVLPSGGETALARQSLENDLTCTAIFISGDSSSGDHRS